MSSFDAQSPPSSVVQLAHSIYVVLLWPIVAAMVLRTRRHFITALTLLTVSAAVEGVAALAQAMGIEVLGLVSEGSRMTGFTPHPNDLGGATAIALVVALMLATLPSANTTVIGRAARWLAVVLIAMGVTLSGSITAMAACGAGILLWLTWPSARTGARLAVAAAIIISLGAIAITQSGTGTLSPVQRLAQVANPTAVSGGSLQDRVSLVEQAWPRIISDPLVGAGLDVADSDLPIVSGTYDTSYQIHGLPVAAWYQSGIFGMLGLVGLLLVVGVLGWRSIRASVDELDVVIGVTLLAAFVGFVVEAMSVPMVFQQYSWIMAALMFAWSRNVEARASEIYLSDVTARAVPSTFSSTAGEQLVTSR